METVEETTIYDAVKSIVASTLKIPSDKFDADSNLETFGMDSIIVMELMTNLTNQLSVSVTPAQFTEVNTLGDLAGIIEKVKNEKQENIDEIDIVEEESLPKNLSNDTDISLKKPSIEINDRLRKKRRKKNRPFQRVLNYINQKYAIDLSYRNFKSIDEIAECLIINHYEDLTNNIDVFKEIDINKPQVSKISSQKIDSSFKENHDIAIVGISCNFPDAPNTQMFWNNLINKKNSIQEIPESRWNWKDFYNKSTTPNTTISKWGALIKDVKCFDPGFFNIKPEEAIFMDPQERLLIQEVYKAFQDAGMDIDKLKGSNTGVFMSYEYAEYENYLRDNKNNIKGVDPEFLVFSSSSPSYYLANRISFVFDFLGPSECINMNCAGSAVAINRAYYSLLNRESDVAVVGGVSLNLFAEDYISLSKIGMLSPNGTCAVFDENANGFTRGEGAASVVLKRLDEAERDNNRIYGVIKNSHQKNRGNARFLQEIKVESFTDVIKECYKKASIKPETIDYIEVDGYATKWGDSFEYEGIKKVFKDNESKEKKCALGSAKGNIGHLESVSGLVSLIKLSLSLYNKKFPATISKNKTSSFIDIQDSSHPLYIADSDIPFESIRKDSSPIRAGVNSFSDSGVNVHILMEEYNRKVSNDIKESKTEPQLFILSAKNRSSLDKYVLKYIDFISTADEELFGDMIYTLQTGRQVMDERLAILATSYKELSEKLTMIKQANGKEISLEKEGVFYGNINLIKENRIINALTQSVMSSMIEQNLHTAQWEQLAQLWICGLPIDWAIAWKDKEVCSVSLPEYPFEKEKYWVDFDKNDQSKDNKMQESIPDDKEKLHTTSKQPKWFFFMSKDASEKSSMKPKEKIDLFFKQEIALQLKKSVLDIANNQNFIDLGMSSIGLISMIAQINDLLHISISPAILFDYSDIQKLTEYLVDNYAGKIENLLVTKDKKQFFKQYSSPELKEEKVNSAGFDNMVAMNVKGEKEPIFAVPGADGNMIPLQHLVHALGKEQPFYGIEAIGLGKKALSFKSVKEIAEFNIATIKKVKPKGPYRLLGFSNGGIIAYEMARILLSNNEKVSSLILLDTISPLQPSIDIFDDLVEGIKAVFINSSGQILDIDVEELKKVPEDKIIDYFYNNIKDLGFNFPKEQLAISINTALVNDKNCRSYKPLGLPSKIDVILIKATEGYTEVYKNAPEDYGWNELLQKPAHIYSIKANHFSIIDRDNSKKIAKKINTFFNRTIPKKLSAQK
ncbi:hypothetical protein ATO12_04980 [Aquimarina atlantica]|uniref:Carrier domain-containing protein n=1 Tax=Aquimarina atlantica TaxID=1317122 RepID=A0A023BPV2_9FLAO|nr:beta-ketoacyl synthase N-terminal-like domain-containing protein [Aquimarina atlantica]EZH71974.1 hypothetical protein ATO12_04980 [Aquimarina atlantica]